MEGFGLKALDRLFHNNWKEAKEMITAEGR